MGKARIALAVITFLTLIGGAFAFKTARTSLQFFTRTNSYASFGTLYSRVSSFIAPHPFLFLTLEGPSNIIAISTTGIAPGAITLTRVAGTETITLPVWVGTTFAARTIFID